MASKQFDRHKRFCASCSGRRCVAGLEARIALLPTHPLRENTIAKRSCRVPEAKAIERTIAVCWRPLAPGTTPSQSQQTAFGGEQRQVSGETAASADLCLCLLLICSVAKLERGMHYDSPS